MVEGGADGRDVPETSALDYVDALEELLESLRRKSKRDYRVASGGGRMLTTMDRLKYCRHLAISSRYAME